MNGPKAASAALLLTIATALPAAAHEAPATGQVLPSQICAGCFAYLEFPSSFEPESYAMRAEATQSFTALPIAEEAKGGFGAQTASLRVSVEA